MSQSIKISKYFEINGRKQFLSIRSSREDLPLLLYLHGGPGDAALPMVAAYNRELEDYFTVVVWEQRGAGKSYYPFQKDEKITISLLVEDIRSIAEILLTRFNQEKLYLAGHSFGSVLGLKFCQKYPEMVCTYVGCGQVVNMKKSSCLAWEYAVKMAESEGNRKSLNRLKNIDCTYSSESWMKDLLFVTGQVVKYKGSLYGEKNYSRLVKTVICSGEYTIKDLINRQKGAAQSIKYLWPELMTVNFEDITNFNAPVVFIEGRYDYHVSSELVKEYYETISSEKSFYWFEHSCHFPQWSEAGQFTRVMASVVQRP